MSGSDTSSGSNTTMQALAPSSGTQFWNTTYNAWFQYVVNRWVPLGSPDPRYGFYLFDEFIQAGTAQGLNWTVGGTITVFQSDTSTQGVAVVRQATAASRSFLGMATNGTLLSAGWDLYLEASVAIPTLATAGEDFVATFGLNDNTVYSATGVATDGVYFSYNRASNGANWRCVTISNASATITETSTAIVAGTFYRLKIEITGVSSVAFKVNGVTVATHATNIPSGSARATGYLFKMDKVAGTANSDLQTDYFLTYGFFNGRVA